MGAAYTGAFELRRLVVRFARPVTAGGPEDSDAFTIHLAKLTGGAPDSNWLTADYTAVEARLDTWWTSAKIYFSATTKLAEYRWYKDGPAWSPTDRADGPANPSVRTTAKSVVGTNANVQLPPQCALTVTKVVDVRKRWGRLYLPAVTVGSVDANGHFINPAGTLAPIMVTLFNGLRADGKQPVVFSRGRSAYVTPKGTAIAAHVATAYEITTLVMDDVFDVMRSRRWSLPNVRVSTVLT